jgi:hypothetical protein
VPTRGLATTRAYPGLFESGIPKGVAMRESTPLIRFLGMQDAKAIF